MLVSGMDLHIEDLAIFYAVGRSCWEKKFLIANLPVSKMLLTNGPIIQNAKVGIINCDTGLKERVKESKYLVYSSHRRR